MKMFLFGVICGCILSAVVWLVHFGYSLLHTMRHMS